MVVRDGFAVSALGKHLSPGCSGEGAGLTVGMVGAEHDYAALTDCVKRVKEGVPGLTAERDVTISASPDVPYQTVISTIDAIRRSGDEELFPVVSFAIPR
jgi:biopolymer transport protein TolR